MNFFKKIFKNCEFFFFSISQAESQELFIKRGILSKKGPSALSKLCSGVSSLYAHAKESYDKIIRGFFSEYFLKNLQACKIRKGAYFQP